MKTNKLTPRQWATYNLIKNASSEGGSVSIEQIIASYSASDHKDGYIASRGAKTHDPCSAVWCDITAINASSEVEKIIIIDNFTYRLATEQEAWDYYADLQARAIRALIRAHNIKNKIRKDGQGKLISCQGSPIDEESRARRFVEAFADGDKENA